MKYCLLLLGMFLFTKVNADTRQNTIAQLVALSDTTVKVKDSLADNMRSVTGLATYYHRKFEGRRTTSGARYKRSKLTAAHLTLPFGTIVTVTNLSNGKSVDVEINDRGPFTKRYIIDVSESAAKELGFFNKGQSRVEISYSPGSEN